MPVSFSCIVYRGAGLPNRELELLAKDAKDALRKLRSLLKKEGLYGLMDCALEVRGTVLVDGLEVVLCGGEFLDASGKKRVVYSTL